MTFIPRRDSDLSLFRFSHTPTLPHSHLPIEWLLGVLSPEMKRPGRKTDRCHLIKRHKTLVAQLEAFLSKQLMAGVDKGHGLSVLGYRQYPCCLLQGNNIANPTPNLHRSSGTVTVPDEVHAVHRVGTPDSNHHPIPEYVIDEDRRRYGDMGVTVVVTGPGWSGVPTLLWPLMSGGGVGSGYGGILKKAVRILSIAQD